MKNIFSSPFVDLTALFQIFSIKEFENFQQKFFGKVSEAFLRHFFTFLKLKS